MATWDATFENKPAGADSPSTLDNEQRSHRKAVEERMANEHDTYVDDSTVGNKVKDWVHKEGSAMAYYEATEPANQPNGETLATRDAGRFWWDSDDDELRCYDGTDMQTIKKISGALEIGGDLTVTGDIIGVSADGAIGCIVAAASTAHATGTQYLPGTTVAGNTLIYSTDTDDTYGNGMAGLNGAAPNSVAASASYGYTGTWTLRCRVYAGTTAGFKPVGLFQRTA